MPEGFLEDEGHVRLFQLCNEMVLKSKFSVNDESVVACRAFHLLKAMHNHTHMEISVLNVNGEDYRRYMKRFIKTWKEADVELRTLLRARLVVMSEIKAAVGQYRGKPAEQHRVAQQVERAFYYRNLSSIHRCYFLQSVGERCCMVSPTGLLKTDSTSLTGVTWITDSQMDLDWCHEPPCWVSSRMN